jgi:hypothetical protein
MKNIFCKILVSLLLLNIVPASAGIKGYKVMFVDLTSSQEFKSIFIKYRASTNIKSVSECWNARKGDWIDIAYAKTRPIAIFNDSIELAVTGDDVSLKNFSNLLSAYRDDEITSGFDGAYIVMQEKRGYTVIGLSRDGTIIKSLNFSKKSIKNLDRGLCAASAAFDKSFSP